MRASRVWALVALASGSMGALAMIPVGLVVMQVPGVGVNVYGELLAHQVFGSTTWWALLAVHLGVGWIAALPVAAAGWWLARTGAAPLGAWLALLAGFAYGAGMWLVLNSIVLPWVYGHASPWATGWAAIWPSLLVHLVYGGATAYSVARAPRLADVRLSARAARASPTISG